MLLTFQLAKPVFVATALQGVSTSIDGWFESRIPAGLYENALMLQARAHVPEKRS